MPGLDEIIKILNDFLAEFECTAVLGDDFYFENSDNTIGFALYVDEEADADFQNFTKGLRPEITADTFLLSLTHELGHRETIDLWEDWEYWKFWRQKELLRCRKNLTKHEKNMEYFNIPDEKAATMWGLNYISTHVDEVRTLWNKLQPAIQTFYKLNGYNGF